MTKASQAAGKLLQAAMFAACKHRDQRRKDNNASPYINHPLYVADVLANEGGVSDIEILCAALLHDTIEDTDATETELREHFGDTITDMVLEVSDDKSLAPKLRKQRQIEHAAKASTGAKQVKLADKICNLRDILSMPPADWSDQRKREYFEWAARVVAGLRGSNLALEANFDRVHAQGMQELG